MKKIIFHFLLLSACLFSNAQNSEKLIIGVLPFTSIHGSNANYVESLREAVTEAFTKTQRFTVVDRSKLENIKAEQEYQMGYDFMNSDIVKQGNAIGVQYFVAGHVNSLNITSQNTNTGRAYVCRISLTLTIISIETKEVVAVKTINPAGGNEWTNAFSYGFAAPKSQDAAFNQALNAIIKEVDKFVDEQFPLTFIVLKVEREKNGEAKEVTVSGGNDFGIDERTKLTVFEKTVEKINGKEYKRDIPIAELKVIRVDGPEISLCAVRDGGYQLKEKMEAGAKLFCKTLK